MRIGKKRGPVMVLLLTLITCSLYYYYWVYVTSREIQDYLQEPDIPPIVELILTILTGGLYLFYWDWKTAKQIARMQERVGIPPQDNSVLYLIINILGVGPIYGLGLIVQPIQQAHLNQVWERARVRSSSAGGAY